MGREIKRIDIPKTDVWSALFDRKEGDRTFPDEQVIYLNPHTSRHYTYASLRHTTVLFGSHLLTSWSWQRGGVLALFAQNCIDTPAVTFGTHYAGGTVSPANPAYNVRELTHHLKDSGAQALVTQKHLLKVALQAAEAAGIKKSRVLLIGEEEGRVEGLGWFGDVVRNAEGMERRERVQVDCERDLAFLVYSSGTTGLPKGVMLSHLNVVSDLFMVNSSEGTLLHWSKDRILSVLPYYHIYGLQCLVHFPAYAGLTTIVMSSFDLPTFCALIQEHKITYTYVAPPVVLHLAKSPVVAEYDLSSLRMITSGAAPLTKELIYAVHKRLGTEVKQAYGLSETSPVTHMQKNWQSGLGSNGPALPNQIVKYMSPDGIEVPQGTEGEVYISGPNVFLGYHNNASATTSSITPDGFFKTGDIGYEDADGNMYITDRVKELIKYKGFQVAPAELEGVLMGCEMVEDCAVIGVWDGERESEVPMACVVARGKREEGELVRWMAERVAGHKQLRGGVWWVDEIPKSASGKILRRVLKDMVAKAGKDGKTIRAKL